MTPTTIASVIVGAALLYAGLGLIFAVAFVTRGVARVDHAAAGAPWPFRLLILPGVAALWPLMLRRWLAAAREPRP
ncbi:MAG: hypothetical protein ACKVU4_13830 [Phycisphaerales bacterium]